MKRLGKLFALLIVAVLGAFMFAACKPPCNKDTCNRHPSSGTCHCHGNCGNEGCQCEDHPH